MATDVSDGGIPEYVPQLVGPSSIADIMRLRRALDGRLEFHSQLASHVFVWAAGIPERPFLTKLGGSPFMHPRRWPEDSNGQPCVFVGQLCFVDSICLFDFLLPGEVLLIFAGGSQVIPEFRFLWADIDSKPNEGYFEEPCFDVDIPLLAGHLTSLRCSPDATFDKGPIPWGCQHQDKQISRLPLLATYQATQIGPYPYGHANVPENGRVISSLCTAYDERVLASIDSDPQQSIFEIWNEGTIVIYLLEDNTTEYVFIQN